MAEPTTTLLEPKLGFERRSLLLLRFLLALRLEEEEEDYSGRSTPRVVGWRRGGLPPARCRTTGTFISFQWQRYVRVLCLFKAFMLETHILIVTYLKSTRKQPCLSVQTEGRGRGAAGIWTTREV